MISAGPTWAVRHRPKAKPGREDGPEDEGIARLDGNVAEIDQGGDADREAIEIIICGQKQRSVSKNKGCPGVKIIFLPI
jgi:hypothetical protein